MSTSPSPSDRQTRSRPPEEPRPAGSLLEALEQEGISWEGQIIVAGVEGDIPALLMITTDRLLLFHHDRVLLEAPRSWLIPTPIRTGENGVRISVTPEGVVPGRATTERLLMHVRDGSGPAAQLVAMLTGRDRSEQFAAEFPDWKSGIGAGRSVALPPLPAFERAGDAAASAPAYRHTDDPEVRGVAPLGTWRTATRDEPMFASPEPEPVEPHSRAARFLTHRSASIPPATTDRKDAPPPADGTPAATERRKRAAGWAVWTARVALLVIAALAATWFARPYLPDDVTEQLPAIVTGEVALSPTQPAPGNASTDTGDGTNGADNDARDILPTRVALGIGGATSDIPDGGVLPTPTPTPPARTETPGDDNSATGNAANTGQTNPADSGETGGGNTNDGSNGETGQTGTDGRENAPVNPTRPVEVIPPTQPAATNVPVVPSATVPVVVEPPVQPEATETGVPDPTQPVQPSVTATTQPTAPSTTTASATTPPPASETAASTATATVTTAGQTPATPEATAPGASLAPQSASVNAETPPAQQFVDHGFRYSIEGVSTGQELPELPQVAPVSYGEWMVLAVSGKNWTDEQQVFDMSRFTLLADGNPVQLDVGNSWVASLMNYTPSYGNTDAILWAPGEKHEFVLTFLAPQGAESLLLQAGNQLFDLKPVLTNAPGLNDLRQDDAPDTIDATVVDVVDGETIVIERDGIRQKVRYLGIDIPGAGACYSKEAAEANRALVAGRNVRIERQATNVDARGNRVRDVWVQQDDGHYELVANQLVREGAATAAISEPNTRFSSWLRGAEADAKAEQRGLWGACGGDAAGT